MLLIMVVVLAQRGPNYTFSVRYFVLGVEMLNRSYLGSQSLELEERFLDWSQGGDRLRDGLTHGRGLCCGINTLCIMFFLCPKIQLPYIRH